VKSPIAFLQVVLEELGTRCGTSTTRDFKTVAGRFEHEGLSFITISLPNFGADFEKSLDQRFVGPGQFAGFQRLRGLPRFLGGFLDLVFDRNSGRLLDTPNIDAIIAVRQLTLMFGKINIPCTDKRTRNALLRYVECEQEVRQFDALLSDVSKSDFKRVGRLLWANLFSAIDNKIYQDSVVPRHGPGATADKLRGNAKFNQQEWTTRLEEVFPHWEHIIPSERFLFGGDEVTFLEPGAERPVKVITVPKTLKTPRIIAMEPTCMQYMQQGILELIMHEIRNDNNAANFVMFESQEHNQLLAREGSINGTLATLDLSEASDRVSNQHVRLLVSDHRALRRALDATRSRKAVVQGHGVIRLAKYASMGSALCFPMEAITFTTVVFLGIEKALNRRLTRKDVESFYGQVRVYGDDIIVPVRYVSNVIQELEAFGFRVNSRKSFWSGKFRESCGREYYDGRDVSIVRMRAPLPVSRQQASHVISMVSMRNQLFHKGFHDTVEWLDSRIERLIPFPVVQSTSRVLGRHAYEVASYYDRRDDDLQLPLVKGALTISKLPASQLDDSGALLKWFLKRGDLPFADVNHLKRAGRPDTPTLKIGWAPPY